jgi:hypothetical protein
VEAWEKGHEAPTVGVSYELNGKVVTVDSDDHFFGPLHNQFTGHFDLPASTTGTITFTAVAHWTGAPESSDTGSTELPPAGKCEESTTTTTVAPTTTTEAVAPSSSLATTTTESAVGAATSTTSGGGQLPFTGASSGPMLLAGIVLVGGGALFLLLSRASDRHAAR